MRSNNWRLRLEQSIVNSSPRHKRCPNLWHPDKLYEDKNVHDDVVATDYILVNFQHNHSLQLGSAAYAPHIFLSSLVAGDDLFVSVAVIVVLLWLLLLLVI
ncbi:hypothetical protein Tco_1227037 [Tanacetum coccineum]